MPAERQPEGPLEEADGVCRRAGAPNPKFTQRCRESIVNFGFKRGTKSMNIPSIPLVPKFASEPAAMLCERRNPDTSAPNRQCAQRCRESIANFEFKRSTRSINIASAPLLLVSLWLRSSHQRVPQCGANFGTGQPLIHHRADHLVSTFRRQTGILVGVHSVLPGSVKLQQPHFPRSGPDGQPPESPQLARCPASRCARLLPCWLLEPAQATSSVRNAG